MPRQRADDVLGLLRMNARDIASKCLSPLMLNKFIQSSISYAKEG